jgi:hypothetical protein
MLLWSLEGRKLFMMKISNYSLPEFSERLQNLSEKKALSHDTLLRAKKKRPSRGEPFLLRF